MLKKIAILAFVTIASPALAHGIPQTQDEWFVNSGRYLNGEVPSYDQAPTSQQVVAYAANHQIVAYKEARGHARVIEGRSSATRGMFYEVPQGYFSTGREQMVSALGA
jgi:hypothetical protein